MSTPVVHEDPWQAWRRHTAARIALGRAGAGLPTGAWLQLGWDHAQARDAVHAALDVCALESGLRAAAFDVRAVTSAAQTREEFLQRPDLGRRLSSEGREALHRSAPGATQERPSPATLARADSDVVCVVGDGLSALAAQRHALPTLVALRPLLQDAGWRLGPVVVAQQCRVALGDEVGQCLKARLVLVLLGERPGLSSPDSLGAYLTFDPCPGRRDSERNCVSNIRPQGLAPVAAARRLAWLCHAALQRGLTGVALKDESTPQAPPAPLGLDGG